MKTKTFEINREVTERKSETFIEHTAYGDRQVTRTTVIEKQTWLSGPYAGRSYENVTVKENGIVVNSYNQPWPEGK